MTKYFFIIIFLIVWSCDAPLNHERKIYGVNHKQDITNPEKYCFSCHGEDPNGNILASSCYSCHSDLWNSVDQENDSTNPATDHKLNKNNAFHLTNHFNPNNECNKCHGEDLKGGNANEPSCYLCHDDIWKDNEHSFSLNGRYHAKGKENPEKNCILCHGPDLTGGSNDEPSCFSCHGKEW